jgi:hypothetical protein
MSTSRDWTWPARVPSAGFSVSMPGGSGRYGNALVPGNPICDLADRLRKEGRGEESVGWL